VHAQAFVDIMHLQLCLRHQIELEFGCDLQAVGRGDISFLLEFPNKKHFAMSTSIYNDVNMQNHI
jgi:hypothetical protein